jgi:hypothetical protein
MAASATTLAAPLAAFLCASTITHTHLTYMINTNTQQPFPSRRSPVMVDRHRMAAPDAKWVQGNQKNK